MNSSIRFLLAVSFVLIQSYSSKAQKRITNYTDYDYGVDLFWNSRKFDSAFLMFNRYVINPDDSLKKGAAYKYMGEIRLSIGDLYGAQESLSNAIRTLDPTNEKHQEELGIVYNLLGNVSKDLKLYDEALPYYNTAIKFFKDKDYLFEAMNGKAIVFQKLGRYKEAVAIYDSTLAFNLKERYLVARLIDNRAKTKWLQDSSYQALPEFWSALKIRIDSQYTMGLNASYAHISDYYVKSNPDSALWYAKKMRESAVISQSPDDVLEAIDKIIRLNDSSVLKERWYEEYKKIDDSLQFSRDTTRNRFAMIRYNFQETKGENLVLQKRITKQELLMYGLVIASIIIIIALSVWYIKRRNRIRQESDIAIRDSKLKTSQKVHDVVANGLYGIMNELEHSKVMEREPLLNKIEDLYEKSRDISYEDISAVDNIDYNVQMHDLLTSFANEQTKVFLVGNQQSFWNKVADTQKLQLQLVLKEIMVNMKKHSSARNVVITFRKEKENGLIIYKDDGVGFRNGDEFGNGLNNTVSRIKSLNGAINFDKTEKAAVIITISFPLESITP